MMQTNVMELKGEITVTEETDGTFYVRIGGRPFLRMPTQEAAEKRAEPVRRFDRENPNGA